MSVTINPCTNGCPVCGAGNYNFCGADTVESEICLVPGINPTDYTIDVTVEVDKANFTVELICCNLIVVCGFITKTVVITPKENGDTITKTKDIPVQIKVPADICNVTHLRPALWNVTGVEVCTGCYTLTCPDKDGNYHKLIEKEIVGVQVDRIAPLG